MVMDVVTAAGSGSDALPAYTGVVLLTALLPFVLSFVGDAVARMFRRGTGAWPFLVAAIVAVAVVAGIGVLLLQLGLAGGGGDAGLTRLARGLLLVCGPLAALSLVLRLSFARTRARRTPPEGTGGTDEPSTDEPGTDADPH